MRAGAFLLLALPAMAMAAPAPSPLPHAPSPPSSVSGGRPATSGRVEPRPAARPGGSTELLRRINAVATQESVLDQSLLARALDIRFVPAPGGGLRGEGAWLAAWGATVSWAAEPGGGVGESLRALLRLRLGDRAACVTPEEVEAAFGRNWRPRWVPGTPLGMPRMVFRLRQRPPLAPGFPERVITLEVAFRQGLCVGEFALGENQRRDR
ncbi:hypothetical protein M0638_01650 [Roseomonas sp. NAR14]|uniref:Uncharacterized protein n=1 Tax=Roseomonas acroporae TaxID=2937791 RepID=A0A9X1Y368_9PROT|nr:hypothetical protein [Roseomonas acroporae]MCK8783084.1 hypothetical protein [Roseomonas acroporae]